MSSAYETDPGAPPPQSRVPAMVLLISLALLGIAILAWLLWYLFDERAEHGAYEAAPECEIGETDVLAELVPGYEKEVEETVGTVQDSFGTGWQCRWSTPEVEGSSVPAAATLLLVAAPVEGGEENAAQTLESTASGNDADRVDDLGEEALAWIEPGAFEVGCTGVRVSNLYLESCYTAATDYDALNSIEGVEAVAEAERLARAIVAELPESIEEHQSD